MQGCKIRALGIILGVFFLQSLNVYADQDLKNIYMIEAAECVSMPDLRIQTGFLLHDRQGIITALHGVIGCNHIIARQPESGTDPIKLDYTEVDIARDVAILTGPNLPASGGLHPHPTGIPSTDVVKVIGHPNAMPGQWDMPLTLMSRQPQKLYLRLGPGLQKAVNDRNSPSPLIDVYSLNGNLQPGHSGAPIMDSEGRVLGIGSGGLGNGTLGIGWAIPIHDIDPRKISRDDLFMQQLAAKEPTLVFAHDEVYKPAIERVIWSSGSGCISQGRFFDLDRGDSNPTQSDGDLFHNARNNVERYLQPNPWGTATMALIGNRDFDRVTFAALQSANYSRSGLSASRDQRNQLPPGTVIAVQTSEGRYTKLKVINSSSDAISFDWTTYSLPSEGKSPLQPAIEQCGPEDWLICDAGTLPHDQIQGFRIIERSSNELLIEVRALYNAQHGQSWMGAYLLDKDGNNLSGGYYPTAAQMGGITQMRVISKSGAKYLFIWLYESNKREAFICRRFVLHT